MNTLRAAIFSALLITMTSGAIVIRHDVDDSEYIKLGEKYSESVAYVGGCAGTLIDPHWVLTAAHCLAGREDSTFFVRHLAQKYRIESIFIHPQFNREQDEIYDVALVQLKDAIQTGKPASLYQQTDEMGMPVIFVGRGTYGNGKDGLIREDFRQRGATNTVDRVDEHVIGFTFTSPESASPLEGISSRGDSGGPAFVELDQQLYVIGVSSYQEGNGFAEGHYGVAEYYTRVSSVYPWLNSIFEQASPPKTPDHLIIDTIREGNLKAFKSAIYHDLPTQEEIIREAFYQSIILDRPDFAKRLIQAGVSIANLKIQRKSLYEFSLQEGRKDYFKMLQDLTPNGNRIHAKHSPILALFISTFRQDPYLYEGALKLIQQGANLDAKTRSGDSALIVAGWNTENFELVKLLVTRGANINQANNNGDTPLMDAAYLGKVENLKYLLQHGADLTTKNKRGKTALHLAEEKGHEEAIRLLRSKMIK